MILNNIIDARFGDLQVSKLILGDKVIWTKEGNYLIITPSQIWYNNEPLDVRILSNTDWKINN